VKGKWENICIQNNCLFRFEIDSFQLERITYLHTWTLSMGEKKEKTLKLRVVCSEVDFGQLSV